MQLQDEEQTKKDDGPDPTSSQLDEVGTTMEQDPVWHRSAPVVALEHVQLSVDTRHAIHAASSNDANITSSVHTEQPFKPKYRGQWPHSQKFSECTIGGKFIWTLTCCNFRYFPGCDTVGFCFWCGHDFNYLANGFCSCLSPFACCCCPCILVGVANCCEAVQDCCRN
jgi:hypothetical protein